MTLDEIRHKVQNSSESEWLQERELNLNYNHIGLQLYLKGISAIYEFVMLQEAGWSKKQDGLPNELEVSRKFFTDMKIKIERLVEGKYNNYQSRDWEDIEREFTNSYKRYFTYDCPEIEFLLSVHNKYPNSFFGSYSFVIDNLPNDLSDRDNFIGVTLAYEFKLKDNTEISERRNAERASIGTIRNDFRKYLTESETQVADYIKKTEDKFVEYSKNIDELKTQKEENFNGWFDLAQNDFHSFEEISKNKLKDLEVAYDQLLSLKKPAEYWNKRAQTLKEEGWKFLRWLVGMVLFGCVSLYLLLWLTPEGMLLSFIKGQASAIKWSIVYVTFISLLAFGIRIVAKAMLSSFHLARDAEEREQLTYVYLALIKESAADEKDRSIILQSLFSRADTGLLKEDSGPTMPTTHIADKALASK